MRADLLEAQACIDWAVAQLPAFDTKLKDWLGANLSVVIKEQPAPATHDVVAMFEKEFLPLAFSVECGAYINAFRSSLDILAVALARRHNITRLKDVYFPMARDEAAFLSLDFKGKDLVKRLPQAERALIENLKPYHGGNLMLWFLHQLDIERKHQKLLDVVVRPSLISIPSDFVMDDFAPTFMTWISANQETALGLLRKGSNWDCNNIQVSTLVTLNHPGTLQYKGVIESLYDFASLADSIINLF